MVRFGDKSTVISTVLLLLIVNAEVINVHATISRRRLLGSIKGSALKKNNRGRRSKMSTSFVEMSESQQLTSLQREWMIMREGVDHLLGGSEVDIMNSDAEDVGGIPPPVGANKYGSPRNRAAESKDTYKAKKVCQCMVNELLFGLTKGVLPYRPNACAGRYCYAFDAGEGVTPLYYKRLNHKWYWRPSKPPTESHRELDEWMRTSTTKVGVSGLSSLALRALQTVGLTDVVDENKFLMKILEDYNPYKLKGHGVPAGSRANSMDAKYDLYMCMDRKHVDSPEEGCHVKKSGCMRNLVARYFQYVEVQTRAIQKRKNQQHQQT